MKTISISNAKATLSQQIRRVRSGDEIVILDRGRPVARLVAIESTHHDEEIDDLEKAGLVRRARTKLPSSFWRLPRPRDSGGVLRSEVLREREQSW
jgi:prevent-host-death family protein